MVFREGRCGEGTDPLRRVVEDASTIGAGTREEASSRPSKCGFASLAGEIVWQPRRRAAEF